jgi:hypothetical protein
MRRYMSIVLAAGMVSFGAWARGQEYPAPVYRPDTTTSTTGSTETIQDTKTITDSKTVKTSTDTLMGKVEGYEAGKWIKVSAPGKIERIRTIDLMGKNLTAHVPSDVKVGLWVSVVTKTDNDGRKTVSVEAAKHAARQQQK